MKGTKINFIWISDNKKHHKQLDRNNLYLVFEGLANGFVEDNRISSILISEIIPYADTILINKDYNSTQTEPSISYSIDGDVRVLKIIRYHKIVWAILDKYCTE